MSTEAQAVLAAARDYYRSAGAVDEHNDLIDAVAEFEKAIERGAIHPPRLDAWATGAGGPGVVVAVDEANCIVIHTPHGETFTLTDVAQFVYAIDKATAARDRRERQDQ